jgi:hypothetical protein
MLKTPAEYDRNIYPAKLTDISRKLSPYFDTRLLLVFVRELQWKKGMIRTLMRKHNRSVNVAWLGAPRAIPSCSSKCNGAVSVSYYIASEYNNMNKLKDLDDSLAGLWKITNNPNRCPNRDMNQRPPQCKAHM